MHKLELEMPSAWINGFTNEILAFSEVYFVTFFPNFKEHSHGLAYRHA